MKPDVAMLIYAHLDANPNGSGCYCCQIAEATGLNPKTVSSWLRRTALDGYVKRKHGFRYRNAQWMRA